MSNLLNAVETGGIVLLAAVAIALPWSLLGVVRQYLRYRERRRWLEDAKYVLVSAPPHIDLVEAITQRQHLTRIERGPWRRWWRGQPYVLWEFHLAEPRIQVRIWIPGGLPTDMVTQAVTTAWPGSVCTVIDAHSRLPDEVWS